MMIRALRAFSVASLLFTALGCAASDGSGDSPPTESADITSAKPDPTAPIANFVKVRDGLYRGGHPDGAGLDYLKKLGVKRIVDLEVGDFIEAFPWDISSELSDAKARGLTELRYPMSAFEPAVSDRFDEQMDEITALLKTATPEDGIYVHCKHGQDRTGLVIGLERVFDEGWKPQDAHDEMVRLGFHTFFLGLNDYFEDKTGWKGG